MRAWLQNGDRWIAGPMKRSEFLAHRRRRGIVVVSDVPAFLHWIETARWPERAATRQTKAGPVIIRHPDGRPVRPVLDQLRRIWRDRAGRLG